MPRVSVVIPTINEAGTIEELIEALQEHRETYDLKIIIVDDGSTDGTIEAIQQLNQRHENITLIERGRKLGFGTAITDGLKTALTQNPKPDLIATMDADLSHDPHQLPQLIQQCTRDTLVIGSRYTTGGEIHGWGPYRKTVSRGANLLARVFAIIRRLRHEDTASPGGPARCNVACKPLRNRRLPPAARLDGENSRVGLVF